MEFINDANYKVEIREYYEGRKSRVVWRCPIHRRWDKMKSRVKYEHYAPSYTKVAICDEWHKFSKFREWITSFDVDITNLEIDKDFKSGLIYSPETCILIPKYINNSIIDTSNIRGEYPLGVSYDNTPRLKAHYKSSIYSGSKRINLGRYYNTLDAHRKWQEQKVIHIQELIERYEKEDLIFDVVFDKFNNIIQNITNDIINNRETVTL